MKMILRLSMIALLLASQTGCSKSSDSSDSGADEATSEFAYVWRSECIQDESMYKIAELDFSNQESPILTLELYQDAACTSSLFIDTLNLTTTFGSATTAIDQDNGNAEVAATEVDLTFASSTLQVTTTDATAVSSLDSDFDTLCAPRNWAAGDTADCVNTPFFLAVGSTIYMKVRVDGDKLLLGSSTDDNNSNTGATAEDRLGALSDSLGLRRVD